MIQKLIITMSGFIIVILLGIVLSKIGKPYNSIVFNAHKIVALGVLIYSFIYMRKYFYDINTVLLICIVVIVVSIIVLFTTGAMMSIGGFNENVLRIIHIIGSISIATTTIILLFSIHKPL